MKVLRFERICVSIEDGTKLEGDWILECKDFIYIATQSGNIAVSKRRIITYADATVAHLKGQEITNLREQIKNLNPSEGKVDSSDGVIDDFTDETENDILGANKVNKAKETSNDDSALEGKDKIGIEFDDDPEIEINSEPLWVISHEVTDEELEEIPWRRQGLPNDDMFIGRNELIEKLIRHFSRITRTQSFMLYGQTRTGKTSILKKLKARIEGEEILVGRDKYRVLPFFIDTGELANSDNAKNFWSVLFDILASSIKSYFRSGLLDDRISSELLKYEGKHRFNDFKSFLNDCRIQGLYPLILFDEFAFIRHLLEKKVIGVPFLGQLREFATHQKASFIFSGTYDLKVLLSHEEFAKTAQFANTLEEPIGAISVEHSIELVSKWPRLRFDDEVKEELIKLTGRIPYFIQILCQACGQYALETEKEEISLTDLITIVKGVVGFQEIPRNSFVERLTDTIFQGNQIDPGDSMENKCLLITIAHIATFLGEREAITEENRVESAILDYTYVSFSQICNLWSNHGVKNVNVKVASGLDSLEQRGVVIRERKESWTYRIDVDLFRIFIAFNKQDIEAEISKIGGNE